MASYYRTGLKPRFDSAGPKEQSTHMPRLTHKLTAALLTFAIGVLVASVWISRHLRDIVPKDGGCSEWEAEATGQGLGWDLTYEPALRRSGLGPDSVYWQWGKSRSIPPFDKLAAEWQGDPITSSILIEGPDGHAGMGALWLIRTKGQAYWWGPDGKVPVPQQEYDRAFEAMACWRQDVPPNGDVFNGREGYLGFLNLYKEGHSRQMLLTSRDWFLIWPTGSKTPDESTWGRLWITLKPVFSSADEQWRQLGPDNK
jgi:hypothetical protein